MRLKLIKAGLPRLVIRKSISHMVVQFIRYEQAGDVTAAAAFSDELRKYGWTAATGNIPAAYLTGLLAGLRAKAAGLGDAVLDLGQQRSTKGSRLYAALKGVLDAGVVVRHSPDVLPTGPRLRGEHIAAWATAAKPPAFAKYRINPRDIPNLVAATKERILRSVKA